MQNQSFKYSIQWLIEIKELNKKEIAQQLGISLRTLNRWCAYTKDDTGSMPFDKAFELSNILNVKVNLLIWDEFVSAFVRSVVSIILGIDNTYQKPLQP